MLLTGIAHVSIKGQMVKYLGFVAHVQRLLHLVLFYFENSSLKM